MSETSSQAKKLRPFLLELRRVLTLEQQNGYTDKSVFHGCLNDYLLTWLKRAKTEVGEGSSLQVLGSLQTGFADYAALNPVQREKWTVGMLDRLAHAEGETETVSGAPGKEGRGPVATRSKSENSSPARQETAERRLRSKSPAASGQTQSLDDPVTSLPGVGYVLGGKLAKVDVHSVLDLLYYFPFRYVDGSQFRRVSDLRVGEIQSLVAEVWQVTSDRRWGRQQAGSEAIVGDDSGNLRIIWFNNPYPAKSLKTGQRIVATGKVEVYGGRRQMVGPDYQLLGQGELLHVGRVIPVHHCGAGLSEFEVRRAVKAAINLYGRLIEDPLPPRLLRSALLMDLPEAIRQIHFPDSLERMAKARRRLAFDELFYIQLGVLQKRRAWREVQKGIPIAIDSKVMASFEQSLPFALTGSQRKAMTAILSDMAMPQPMTRLLQGEVGSGKTVIAAAAIFAAIHNGYQGVIMAPTEILAEQHYRSLQTLLRAATYVPPPTKGKSSLPLGLEDGPKATSLDRPVRICLLVGSLRKSEKEAYRRAIAEGEIDLIVGTHAIIQEGVEFARLGLSVVDEQHRFGVMQRSALRQKGANPHLLVMTATPIPRTLALTIYGDLDLSAITELPPGRRPVKTFWLKPQQRTRSYEFIRKQVAEGRQAFIICPLVEESEKIEAKAATVEFERLAREVFPDLRLGLLHGRMTAAEKDRAMTAFRDNAVQVLVSTAVVEVGIDIPNASVMLVEGADRFGLSQLHQFRGRVGRGAHDSFCLLLSDSPSDDGKARLAILEQTSDGFQLAEEDLKLRGPGEFFGTRQSGLPDLRMAKLSDVEIMELSREQAIALFKDDPLLEQPQHRLIAERMRDFWQRPAGEPS